MVEGRHLEVMVVDESRQVEVVVVENRKTFEPPF